jgi:hypothetical protein
MKLFIVVMLLISLTAKSLLLKIDYKANKKQFLVCKLNHRGIAHGA